MIDGSLEVKLPTIWTDEKERWEESEKRRGEEKRRKEEKKREDQRREGVRRKKMQVREKVEKSRFTVFFPMICGSGRSKRRLTQAAGAEPSGRMREKMERRCGPKQISKSKCTKPTNFRPLLEVEMSKKCTPLWCEAHVEVKKHKALGALLEVEMSKKCTPLWREAHFQVKMYKAHQRRTSFGS